MKDRLAPSMMCCDILRLGEQLKILEEKNVELLHIDIMDGHFVPNFTLGTDFARQLKTASRIPLDLHFMTERPEQTIPWFPMGEGDYDKAQKQGYTFLILGFLIGCVAALVIALLRSPIINYYEVSDEAKAIAYDLMDAIILIIIFQSMNSILTKGVLRAGGDTKFLMAGDILFLWVASIPLGALAGLVFHWSSFWIYTMLKIDQIIKCVWCYYRLKSGKWLKKIRKAGENG